MTSDTALLFPGQGAHNSLMLEGLRSHSTFKDRYGIVCESLGFDPLKLIAEGNESLINENAISSLLTVLISVICLDEWLINYEKPRAIAGYSVGQWTALYAAGVVTFEQLVSIIKHRASLMDKCFEGNPGEMMAVIGVYPVELSLFCEGLRNEGYDIVISNFNCFGQYSLAGNEASIDVAIERITSLKPKKYIKLPTNGAWHCHLLQPAAVEFSLYLEMCRFSAFNYPVIDNVTGSFLPFKKESLLEQLSLHISHPVQWETGLKTLIEYGCKSFVEVGYGNTLTKFGFFVDRSVEHSAFYPSI